MIAFAGLLTANVYYPQTNLGLATIMTALVANTAGGLLPDLDQATNRLWGMLPFGRSVGKIFNELFLSHRGLTHSLLGIFLVDKIVYWLLPIIFNGTFINFQIVSISLMIGYISHLCADGVTEEGLPLLYPLKYKFGLPPTKSWRIKTGEWFESLVVTPGVIAYIVLTIITDWKAFTGVF